MSNKELSKLGLVDREMRGARREARTFLTTRWGDRIPVWSTLGADEQVEIGNSYIKFLRDGRNTSIANKLVVDKEVIYEMLKLQIKIPPT